jgi:hypothetical protein
MHLCKTTLTQYEYLIISSKSKINKKCIPMGPNNKKIIEIIPYIIKIENKKLIMANEIWVRYEQ